MKIFPRQSKKCKFFRVFCWLWLQSAHGGTLEFCTWIRECTFSPEIQPRIGLKWTRWQRKEWTYPVHSGSISLTFINSRTGSLSNSGTLVHSYSIWNQNGRDRGGGGTPSHMEGGTRLVRWIRDLVSRKITLTAVTILPYLGTWQLWEDLVYLCNPLFYENSPLFNFIVTQASQCHQQSKCFLLNSTSVGTCLTCLGHSS